MRSALILTAILVAGCGGSNVASVTITPASTHISVGGNVVLMAQAFDAKKMKTSTTFTWATDKPAVATVDGSGKVNGVTDGLVNVTASASNGVKGSAVVQVGTGGGNVLTVMTSGTGMGTVTSSPAGIDCGMGCAWGFPVGSMVTLTATPAKGSYFHGWGGACSGTGPCTLTMNQDQQATAEFDTGAGPTLTVVTTGTGSGTVTSTPAGISCTSGATTGCSAVFPSGTQVTLAATATTGQFLGWSGGGCAGTGSCAVTLTTDTQVTATIAMTRTISVTIAGDGTGHVVSMPAGIDCSSGSATGCSFAFPDTVGMVTLTAAPTGKSSFGGWTASGCGSDTTCMIVPGNNATASFSSWLVHHPFPSRMQDLTQLGSTVIAVGGGGLVASAPTMAPLAWTGRSVPSSAVLHGVAASGSTAVAVGDGGVILTSGNGTSWTGATSGTTANLQSVAYGAFTGGGGGNGFVAVGDGGLVLTSSNGTSWTAGTSGTTQNLTHVANGGNSFVAVGALGTIITSADGGATWTARMSGTTQNLDGIVFGGGKFMAVGAAGTTVLSNTGTFDAWTAATISSPASPGDLLAIAFGGAGNVFSVSTNHVPPNFLTSSNGTAWTAATSPSNNERFIGMNGAFYAMGEFGSVITANDGATWSYSLPPADNSQLSASTNLAAITIGGSTLVAGGTYGAMFTSTDGVTWTLTRVGSAGELNAALAFGANLFVAVGNGSAKPRVLTSADGSSNSWGASGLSATINNGALQSVIFDATKKFIAVGYQGSGTIDPLVVTSANGTGTWTVQPGTNLSGAINSVACDGTTAVVTSDTTIYTSTDLQTWTANTTTAVMGDMLGPIAFGGGKFVVLDVSHPEVTLTSPDGATWTRHTGAAAVFDKSKRNGIVFGNGVFMTNTLAQSADGVSWTPGTLPANADVLAAVYANATLGWVTSGSNETILMHQ